MHSPAESALLKPGVVLVPCGRAERRAWPGLRQDRFLSVFQGDVWVLCLLFGGSDSLKGTTHLWMRDVLFS